MNEMQARAAVVKEAREWVRTPYVHGGRIKGKAADCTFISMVYENAGITGHVDIPPYGEFAHLHRAAGIYLDKIREQGAHETDEPKLGDIVLYWFGRQFSHGGIVVGWPNIIHADKTIGCVMETFGDQAHLAAAKKRIFLTLW